MLVSVDLSVLANQPLQLSSDEPKLDKAFVIALSDINGNIHPEQYGLLKSASPGLAAGADYRGPFTRDAAINTWNAAGLLWPTVARNTLLSVMKRKDGRLIISGQYWDAIILVTGAWKYYLYTGDRAFLAQAFEAGTNTLAERESNEFDKKLGLFRGPAVYADGVAAYPDRYAGADASSAILDWPKEHPDMKAKQGYGLPMCTLSLNCLYVHTYRILPAMARALGFPADPAWERKADQLQISINKEFWSRNLGRYIYLIDPWGTDDRQEALGLAFSVLFGVANHNQQESLFRNTVTTPAGMPCLWPPYPRYTRRHGFGRHSGTVWPFAQAFWADAAAQAGHSDIFARELTQLADKAVRDGQFYEIYNPVSGLPYGGLQESGTNGICSWGSARHQTWSATGYLRLILFDLVGMRFGESGITFSPLLPDDIHQVSLTGVRYRDAILNIHIQGSGKSIARMTVNGETSISHCIPQTAHGVLQIAIRMSQ